MSLINCKSSSFSLEFLSEAINIYKTWMIFKVLIQGYPLVWGSFLLQEAFVLEEALCLRKLCIWESIVSEEACCLRKHSVWGSILLEEGFKSLKKYLDYYFNLIYLFSSEVMLLPHVKLLTKKLGYSKQRMVECMHKGRFKKN